MTEQEALLERLRTDWPFYAPLCLNIVATSGKVIPFAPKPAQLRIDEAAEKQRQAGRPVRLIIPKARKEGVSTYATGKLVQRVTQTANHNAIQVAQDGETAGELLSMATLMHANLPDTDQFPIKPPIANRQRRKEIVFGNPARNAQAAGDMGLNSRLIVQSAAEFEAGRGFTFHSVHGSECAFWADLKRKLTSLLNAVPDEPETFVLLESTCNGHNHWRTLCYQAQEGENDFELVFLPWFEEPQYTRPFVDEEERAEFEASVGTGPYGQAEPDLIELHGVSLEQLKWRRWAIANRCQGDLRVFQQEYPAHLDEAFGSTGKTVFNSDHIARARKAIEDDPKPTLGRFKATASKSMESRFGTVDIPTKWEFTPEAAGPWRIFTEPEPGRQYVVAVDPAGDDPDDLETSANHAAQVIDHLTGVQVAELEMEGDTDLAAEQIFLAAQHYNKAWVAVEMTGGYGTSFVKLIHKTWRHPFMYRRKSLDSRRDDESDRMGWMTDRGSRPLLIDGAVELLREGSHGIRSPHLVKQMTTFVKNSKGKPVPAPGERSDLLMAWMIAQQVRQELPVRRAHSGGVLQGRTRRLANAKTGW